ncbi:MAG: glycosyltransferase family 39 protein [Bdellovibrionales bacterium]|nr:glycosyltransferase family 39 protein [Bdellovibrionales bacterium]
MKSPILPKQLAQGLERHRDLIEYAFWFFIPWFGFLIGIQRIQGTIFDEYHYISETFRLFSNNQLLMNHPPLGKILIRTGILIFGHNPLGWRISATVFGAICVTATYAIARKLYDSKKVAHTAAFLTFSNGLLWSMARVGMLDIFCSGFSLLAVWKLLPLRNLSFKDLGWGAVFLGAACASKWNGALVAGPICAVIFYHSFRDQNPRQFLKTFAWASILLLGTYLSTYFPLILARADFPSIFFVVQKHSDWIESHAKFATEHDYMSAPHQWPTIIQPIWLYFQKVSPTSFRGVFCVGNPALFLLGLVALGAGFIPKLRSTWNSRDVWAHRLAIMLWFSAWAGWYVIPRQIEFFYYYLFSSLVLPWVLAKFLEVRWKWTLAIVLMGFFFYPVVTGLELPENSIGIWAWLDRWT